MNQRQTQTHKIHHGPDLGQATTFPLIVLLCLAMGPTLKCHFVLGFPNASFEIPKVEILATLEVHNFVCKPLIEVRSKAKL